MIAPRPFERLLGLLCLALLAVAAVAVARGLVGGRQAPTVVWLHLVTAMAALALTPVILWLPRGTPGHRLLGWLWVLTMAATALASFAVRGLRHGQFSAIHLLSVFTLVMLARLVARARRHDAAGHRQAVLGIVCGALLIAGSFTFAFGRMLGVWLLG